ncbi:MAG: diguanylate cyclase [Frankiales bacterium]|nr:diguanylate cyclase [Frankiales bacterium]
MNPVGLALRGLDAATFLGTDLLARTHGQGNDDAADAYLQVARTGEVMHRRIVADAHSGQHRAYEVSGCRVPTGDDDPPWLLSLAFRDVTHALDGQRRAERNAADLERLVRTDPLTGLLNRRGWQPALAAAVREAGDGGGAGLCVAIADLDRFKDYDDRRGHLAGDDLLRELGACWTTLLGPGQTMARLGGEEFGLVLPGLRLEAATACCDRLRGQVPDRQTVSVGLTSWQPGELAEATLRRADAALYQAKHAGRDRVSVLVAPPAA